MANDVTAAAASASSSSKVIAGLRTLSIVAPLTRSVPPIISRLTSATSAAPLALTSAPPGRRSAVVAAGVPTPTLTPVCGLVVAASAPLLSGTVAWAPPLPPPPPAPG
ncbi:hypothetical protein Vafri_20542 [Volvox africanus]|uniref:Uncharacterized protein n=1 Tax=Volvox africanus TaxID=51714 RepID=A0A8J4FD75_9CHLO|nr:hypothetical protein Vafri_20542 [Volvox africanus]